MNDHTPELYRAVYTDLPYGPRIEEGWTVDGPQGSVCTLDCPLEDREAMAKRIAAALNACAGIPTEQLGDKSVIFLVQTVRDILEHVTLHPEIVSALDEALAPFRKD